MSREKAGGDFLFKRLAVSFFACFIVIVGVLWYFFYPPTMAFSPLDPSSFSRPDLAVVKQIDLSLKVNFERKIFSGNVTLSAEKVDEAATEVILDVDKLEISEVYETDLKKVLNYKVSKPVKEFGSTFSIDLPPKEGSIYKIKITYTTSPDASGLQWLLPQQTAGKKFPYVFSQFQPIHARSFLPCQDTPGVKTKYTAVIETPNNMVALMSAIRKEYKDAGTSTYFHFTQEVPVPSYLIAIAIGVLEARRIGPRSHVWAEKEVLDAAAYEFADTEKQLKVAESICGPYVWGIYDLLVLPPSFPFGGMENPCLTFVTPTLLAGDRSLANVVAHEIAHSWTGNLVTNKNFEHFWLNEGFTVFIERKIIGKLESALVQDFDAFIGTKELQEVINTLGKDSPLTDLVVNLRGVHPDDAFSRVPYEKGHTFLRYLESIVGGPEKFEPFLREYFETFKYKSIVTDDFKSYFESYFKDEQTISGVDWNTWLFTPGMPIVIPNYNKTLAQDCDVVVHKWLKWHELEPIPFTRDTLKNFTTEQRIYLLQSIMDAEPQSAIKLKEIEDYFMFKDVKNSEIKYRWLRICIKGHWEEKIDVVLKWINEVGRMKFVRPLYRELYDWHASRSKAIENFKENRKYMMHVVAYTVAKDLHLSE